MSTSQESTPDAMREDSEALHGPEIAASSEKSRRQDLHEQTGDVLAVAATSHDEEAFAAALAAVPDAPPLPGDEM